MTEPLTSEEIGELERLLEKATPAPWAVEDPLGPGILSVIANASGPVYDWRHIAQLGVEAPDDPSDIPIIEQEANAALIAAMRNALPRLLSSLKRGKEEGSAAQVPPPIASTAKASAALIEPILARRSIQGRLDGYTIATAQEIAALLIQRPQMPTPLYVTQQDKSIILKFNTQEEADIAARYLSALATAHADATHVARLECAHVWANYTVNRIARKKCAKCGQLKIDDDRITDD